MKEKIKEKLEEMGISIEESVDNTIKDEEMVELAEFFGVKYRKDFLNL